MLAKDKKFIRLHGSASDRERTARTILSRMARNLPVGDLLNTYSAEQQRTIVLRVQQLAEKQAGPKN